MPAVPYITKENAAELQKLSVAARLSPFTEGDETANEAKEAERFRVARLARVRNQIVRLDRQLAGESDPARLDRLVSALNRLQDAEGWLANRAKPGNLKPVAPRKSASRGLSSSAPEPDDITPGG